ncbi:hypothetical protein [Amycolatopsis magusensis]
MTRPENGDEPLDPAEEEGPVGGGFTGGVRELIDPPEPDESDAEPDEP